MNKTRKETHTQKKNNPMSETAPPTMKKERTIHWHSMEINVKACLHACLFCRPKTN